MTAPHVKPELIRWARERAGFEPAQLSRRFPSLARWERGERRPSAKSVQRFARAMHVSVEALYLAQPPVERLPIPDLRASENPRRGRLSPDLIEIVDVCRGRQAWYREFVRATEGREPSFEHALKPDEAGTAAAIREALGLTLESQRKPPTWVDALRKLTERVEALGILVMSSSVVLNDNRRRLRPEEFRGFTLADPVAPLVFVNASQTKAEQMFTLAHQLVHAWFGQSGVCDAQVAVAARDTKEAACDRIAGGILVPLEALRAELRPDAELRDQVVRLTRRFKVSPAVILRRMHDAETLDAEDLAREVEEENERQRARPKGKGGNFYLSLGVRVSKRFARALVASAADGRASPDEALRLLGLRRVETLRGFGQRLGVT